MLSSFFCEVNIIQWEYCEISYDKRARWRGWPQTPESLNISDTAIPCPWDMSRWPGRAGWPDYRNCVLQLCYHRPETRILILCSFRSTTYYLQEIWSALKTKNGYIIFWMANLTKTKVRWFVVYGVCNILYTHIHITHMNIHISNICMNICTHVYINQYPHMYKHAYTQMYITTWTHKHVYNVCASVTSVHRIHVWISSYLSHHNECEL